MFKSEQTKTSPFIKPHSIEFFPSEKIYGTQGGLVSEHKTFDFKGLSGADYSFDILKKEDKPSDKPGIYIMAKKLAFKGKGALFLLPLIIKPTDNLAKSLVEICIPSVKSLDGADRLCIIEETDNVKRQNIYRDLLDKYDEGDLRQRSEQF